MFDILESGIRQGVLLVPLAMGVHVAFRFIRYPDLTADGSILMGSSLSVVALSDGVHPLAAILIGMLGGGALGCVTALLSEVVGLDRILAGISSSLLSYTIALRVLGRGNMALPLGLNTIFGYFSSYLTVSGLAAGCVLLGVVLVARSQVGLRLRAVGENQQLSAELGGRVGLRVCVGLFWANACVALSGGLLAQYQRFVDVGQGAGTLFAGLACILIGGAIPLGHRMVPSIIASAAGAIIYASLIAISLRAGFRPGDLRAVTAVLVIITAWLGMRFVPKDERVPLFG